MEITVREARLDAYLFELVSESGVLKFSDTLAFTRMAARYRKAANELIGDEEEALKAKIAPIRDEIRKYLEAEDLKGEALEAELLKKLMENEEAKQVDAELKKLYDTVLTIDEKPITISLDSVKEDVELVTATVYGQEQKLNPHNILRNLYSKNIVEFT